VDKASDKAAKWFVELNTSEILVVSDRRMN
jgi:hypothetical protein